MRLGEHDAIVGAWAAAPSGPGWSNFLVYVCIRDGRDGSHRVDAFQPEEQDERMISIFPFARVASDHLIAAAQNWTPPSKAKPRPRRTARGTKEKR